MRARRKEHVKSIFGAHVQSSSIKSMRAVVLVVGCYVVCYVPFMCLFAVRLLEVRSPGLDVAFHCLCTLAILNPMLNPFIYSWKNASVRNALRQFLDKVLLLVLGPGRHEPAYLRKQPSTTATSLSGGSGQVIGQGRSSAALTSPRQDIVSSTLVVEKYAPLCDVI